MKTLILLLFITSFGLGQNLVPNPSFEEYDTCPNTISQIHFASSWFNPTTGTTDYFNECAISDTADIPQNLNGYQNAKNGFAYGGFVAFWKWPFSVPYREYLEVKLNSPLQIGKKYCVEFNVSLADSVNYAIDDIGAYFSSDSIFSNDYFNLSLTPQVSNLEDNFLTDKINWVSISGDFIANGGENFLLIGNFKDDSNTDTLHVLNGAIINSYDYDFAYYYIDSILVMECDNSDISEMTESEKIIIYPLDSKGIYQIDLYNLSVDLIEVFDYLGQPIIHVKNIKSKDYLLDLSKQSSGAYFVNIQFQNKVISKKAIY